jgi:phosphoribosyl-AMP cyclohydrolase
MSDIPDENGREGAFAALPEKSEELERGGVFAPRFDDNGLLPAIASDADSGQLLMFAWMNEEALRLSVETGVAHYWSRSRGKLWKKGEESGNIQKIVEMRTDCDQDVIWMRVEPQGVGAACHTGRKSCFYRSISLRVPAAEAKLELDEEAPLFDPAKVYDS